MTVESKQTHSDEYGGSYRPVGIALTQLKRCQPAEQHPENDVNTPENRFDPFHPTKVFFTLHL
jgi:hypothetical protein